MLIVDDIGVVDVTHMIIGPCKVHSSLRRRIQMMMMPKRCSGRGVRIVLSADGVRACAGCVIQSRKRGSDVGQQLMANCDNDSDSWLWFRVG